MKHARGLAVLLFVSLAFNACAARPHATEAQRDPPINVVVENRNFYDAKVYVVMNGSKQRVGDVSGLIGKKTFNLSKLARFNGNEYLRIELIGWNDDGYTIPNPLSGIFPGSSFHLMIEGFLQHSYWTIK